MSNFQLSLPMVMLNTNRTILNELFGSRWDPQTKRQEKVFHSASFSREVLQAKKRWLFQALQEHVHRDLNAPWKQTFAYTCHIKYVASAALYHKILNEKWPAGFILASVHLDGWTP